MRDLSEKKNKPRTLREKYKITELTALRKKNIILMYLI